MVCKNDSWALLFILQYNKERLAHWALGEAVVILVEKFSNPWASYQIRKTERCACAGNAGDVFPATDFKGNR